MYKILPTSWHYRLWVAIQRDNKIPNFFSQRWGTYYNSETYDRQLYTGIPTDLCSYINRLLLYFLLQVPFLIGVGVAVGVNLIVAPLCFITARILGLPLDPGLDSLGCVWLGVYFGIGVCLLIAFLSNKAEEEGIAVPAHVTKMAAIVASPFAILLHYIVSIHRKVCLTLQFEEFK